MKTKTQYAIISHDRHRDDYVYIIECSKEEINDYIEKIWKQDFGSHYDDTSGSYYVEEAIIKNIN